MTVHPGYLRDGALRVSSLHRFKVLGLAFQGLRSLGFRVSTFSELDTIPDHGDTQESGLYVKVPFGAYVVECVHVRSTPPIALAP